MIAAAATTAENRLKLQQVKATESRIPAYVWLFLAGLIFSMFSGHSELMGLPLGLDRPLFLLSFILLILDRRTESLRWRAVYPVMALMVIWTLLSWINTGELTDSYKAFAFLDRVVMLLAMFFLGALIFSTERRRMLLLRTSALLGIYFGFTAIAERIGADVLLFPRYISTFHENEEVWRAYGPFGGAEAMGMAAAITFFLSCFLFHRVTGKWRWVAGIGAVLSLVANAMSMTRSAWLGLVLALVACVVLLPALRRWVPVVIVGFVTVGGLILAVLPSLREDLLLRLGTDRSLYDRANTNDAALRAISAEPLQGIGWGQFITDNVLWVRQADTIPVTNVVIEVHNVFLARAAELGIPGAVLWILCVLLGPVLALLSKAKLPEMHGWKVMGWCALLVWFVPSMTSPNPYPMPNFLIWLIFGIAGRGFLIDLPTAQEVAEAGGRVPATESLSSADTPSFRPNFRESQVGGPDTASPGWFPPERPNQHRPEP